MALPKLNNEFKFIKVELPSGKSIGIRGWRVRDEKELLFSLESEQDAENKKINYIISFLKNCTDDSEKFDTLSESDIKRLCVEIRKQAKGDTIEYDYKCPDCGMELHDEVSLTESLKSSKFNGSPHKIRDDVIMTFSDVPYKVSEKLFKEHGSSETKFTYFYLVNSIDSITMNDETFTNYTPQEVDEWLDDMDSNDMEKVYEKFDKSISTVTLERKIKCLKCKAEVDIDFGDLLSFLVL